MTTDESKIVMPESLWAATAIPAPSCPALEGSVETEVAIIGAGFTGLSAALHLRQQGVDCIVVDAGEPGIGASGRNGGQVNPSIKKPLEHVQKIWGAGKGEELYRVIGTAPDLVFELVKEHDIDCHAVRSGIIQPAYSSKSLEYVTDFGKYQQSIGAPVEMLDRQQVHDIMGTDFYIGGFIDHRAGSVHPLSYCRGLANTVLRLGGRICGDTPVIKLEDLGAEKKITTSRGIITARYILAGTNGYTNLVPDDPHIERLSRTVIPFYSYLVATDPMSPEMRQAILSKGQTVADTRRLLTYYRQDHEGRLVMGSSGGPYDAGGTGDYRMIESRITELYPDLGNAKIEFRWSGKVCITPDYVPHVHEILPGVYTGLGYNGRGVAMGTLMGKWLASMVSDVAVDTAIIPVSAQRTLPFHGMRKPVLNVLQIIYDWQDRIER